MSVASVPLAELIAAARTTSIPEVSTYAPMGRGTATVLGALSPVVVGALGIDWIRAQLDRRAHSTGASPATAGSKACSIVWAEARAPDGASARSLLTAGEGFDFAARAVVLAVEQLASDGFVGFGTPAAAFGPDHVLAIEGVERTDLD